MSYTEAREKCAVVGVIGTDVPASEITVASLAELQHRGHDSTGISATDGRSFYSHKGLGEVTHVYANRRTVNQLPGNSAIGHNRYRTSGPTSAAYIQPIYDQEFHLALVHNGNISNSGPLLDRLNAAGQPTDGLNDSQLMYALLRYYTKQGASLPEAFAEAYPTFIGGASVVVQDREQIVAARDPNGLRPLSFGTIDGGYAVASETCALDHIGAKRIENVNPGEMIIFEPNRFERRQLAPAKPSIDAFELLYFARPDSLLEGQRLQLLRENLGRQLAQEFPIYDADVVVGVPDSGLPAALGYAHESGVPYTTGLLKNNYAGRTFIEPDQTARQSRAQVKYRVIPENVKGKNVVVIDDSIVRGNTMPVIARLMWESGARRIDVLSAAPKVLYPDYYGVDTADTQVLIARYYSGPEMAEIFGVNSVGFLSIPGLYNGLRIPVGQVADHHFTGDYPVSIGVHAQEVELYKKMLKEEI